MTLLALPLMLLTLAGSSTSQIQLTARWLLLQQVALHIRGRLTTAGHPLGGFPITLSAQGRGGTRVLGHVRTAPDGSFGVHYRVVRLSDSRNARTRRTLERRFTWISATFRGSGTEAAARLRVRVARP